MDTRGQKIYKLVDDPRVTPIGAFLRKTSLDELPQLWNVLRGDMSLVGPRPLLTKYLPLYSERHRRRHDVRPGITGLAQVGGRNAITWPQKLDLDKMLKVSQLIFATAWQIANSPTRVRMDKGMPASVPRYPALQP